MSKCPHCHNKFCTCQGEVRFDYSKRRLIDGEPCDHPGCLSHISHPCEGCGRVGGRWPEDIPKARKSDPETSHEAAKSMTDEAASQRRQILEYLQAHGPTTADGLDEGCNLRLTSAGRRLSEMKGLVKRTGEKGTTRSGRPADLWTWIP